ncbi:MAG: hypothetical protein ACKOW8_13335, partial [Flavobacteriales bacterium]
FIRTVTDYNGCVDSISQSVTFYAATPTGDITSTSGFNVCPDATLNLSASLPNGIWTSQDPSVAEITPAGQVVPNNSLFDGSSVEACYTRSITPQGSNNTCSATTCATITILPKPRITLLTDNANQSKCAGESINTIQWQLENNTGYSISELPSGMSYSASGSALSGVLPFVTTPTNYAYTLTASNDNGCQSASGSGVLSVLVTPRVASGIIEEYVCSESAFAVVIEPSAQNIPGSNYEWSAPSLVSGAVDVNDITSGGNGDNIAASVHNLIATEAILNYTVTATEGECSSDPFTLKMHILPKPMIGTLETDAGCPGDTINFIPAQNDNIIPSGTTYTWAPATLPSGITGPGV